MTHAEVDWKTLGVGFGDVSSNPLVSLQNQLKVRTGLTQGRMKNALFALQNPEKEVERMITSLGQIPLIVKSLTAAETGVLAHVSTALPHLDPITQSALAADAIERHVSNLEYKIYKLASPTAQQILNETGAISGLSTRTQKKIFKRQKRMRGN